jgi:hypothetical protein
LIVDEGKQGGHTDCLLNQSTSFATGVTLEGDGGAGSGVFGEGAGFDNFGQMVPVSSLSCREISGQATLECTIHLVEFFGEEVRTLELRPLPGKSVFTQMNLLLGLADARDAGLKIDVLVEALIDGEVVDTADSENYQLDGLDTGGVGFQNAVLGHVWFEHFLLPAVTAETDLAFRVSVRRSLSLIGPDSGTVRIWFNGDSGSRIVSQTDSFLRRGFTLAPTSGGTPAYVDVHVDSVALGAYKTVGTWTAVQNNR